MDIKWIKNSWAEYQYFLQKDSKKAQKIKSLIADIMLNGVDKGIGKPEALKHDYSGCYSRRIDQKNRLVYYIDNYGEEDVLVILACRYHYNDK